MPLADEFLRKPASTDPAGVTADARYPLVIEPRVCAPPDIVVYEFGARLDASCRAAASEQIDKAQRLYNTVIGCIRDVHNQMNAWVLERAGLHAQALQAQFAACEQEIASARAANEFERLRLLSPQRVAIGAELTSLLRPVRDRHRAEIRALFFARVGNTTNTETYQLRCRAVDEGLGWATATEVLDSALLTWKKSLALGRAPCQRAHMSPVPGWFAVALPTRTVGAFSLCCGLLNRSGFLARRRPRSQRCTSAGSRLTKVAAWPRSRARRTQLPRRPSFCPRPSRTT